MQGSIQNELDITGLFHAVGLQKKARVVLNENTYPIDEKEPKNNWLYIAFLGFRKLRERLEKPPGTFVSIGTGPGIDGIGANEILAPKRVILTDIHENVLPIAAMNFLNNLNGKKPFQFKVFKGNLCAPLHRNKIRADLIYANLPNIPSKKNILNGIGTASYFAEQKNSVPEEFEKRLLSLQYLFLQDAKRALKRKGYVLLNIGARVPCPVVEKMFAKTCYSVEELATNFKLQTEAETVFAGYAKAEEKWGLEFDFYRYNESLNELPAKELDSMEMKRLLERHKVNAKTALALHRKGVKVGHIAHLLLARGR